MSMSQADLLKKLSATQIGQSQTNSNQASSGHLGQLLLNNIFSTSAQMQASSQQQQSNLEMQIRLSLLQNFQQLQQLQTFQQKIQDSAQTPLFPNSANLFQNAGINVSTNPSLALLQSALHNLQNQQTNNNGNFPGMMNLNQQNFLQQFGTPFNPFLNLQPRPNLHKATESQPESEKTEPEDYTPNFISNTPVPHVDMDSEDFQTLLKRKRVRSKANLNVPLTKMMKIQTRREKKSNRERARRVAIAGLFNELNFIIGTQQGLLKAELEGRNRAKILSEAILFFKKTLRVSVEMPEFEVDAESEDNVETRLKDEGENDQEDNNSEYDPNRAEMLKRSRKSKREKERRQHVNSLAATLGKMLNCDDFNDKLVVLTQAVKTAKEQTKSEWNDS